MKGLSLIPGPGKEWVLFIDLYSQKVLRGEGAFLDSGKVMGAMEQYWATFISVEQRRGIGGRRNSGYKSLFASTTHPPSHLVTFLLGIILSFAVSIASTMATKGLATFMSPFFILLPEIVGDCIDLQHH